MLQYCRKALALACIFSTLDLCSCFSDYVIGIKIRPFDPAGTHTSFLYDGGSVEITCFYMDGATSTIHLYLVAPTYSKKIAYGRSPFQQNISINSTSLGMGYRCIGQKNLNTFKIDIHYVLCNPMSIQPRKVCPESGQFCHITKHNLTQCNKFNGSECLYGFHERGLETRKDVQVLPKLHVVCGRLKPTRLGLCHYGSKNKAVDADILTNDTANCIHALNLSICGKDCKRKENRLIMAGWDFLDVAKPFSTQVLARVDKDNVKMVCNIGYTENGTIRSNRITFMTQSAKSFNAVDITQHLKQLSTPNIANIVCNIVSKTLQFQTSLLVFRSDTDLQYNVSKESLKTVDENVIYNITVNVTVSDGLSVCVRLLKGRCLPIGAGNSATFETVKVYKKRDDNYTITFHIQLFASSPKQQYVLLHDETVNWSLRTSERYHPTAKALGQGMNGTTYKVTTRSKTLTTNEKVLKLHSKKDNGWKVRFSVTTAIGIIAGVGTTVIVIVLLVRFKNEEL